MVRLGNIKFLTLLLIVIALVGSQLAYAQSSIFYNSTFALLGNGGLCYYIPEYVYNSAGSTVIGTISLVSGSVDFFILNASQEEKLVNHQNASTRGEGGCASLEPVDYEFQARGLSVSVYNGYSFTYNVTDNGRHYFVFLNTQSANAIVSMVLAWGGSPASTQASYSPSYSPLSTPYTSEKETTTAQTTVQLESGMPYIAAAVAVIFALVLVTAWLYFGAIRKRQKETAQPPSAQETAAKPRLEQSPLSTKQFCIECASELPAGSRFCNKCGTEQVI